MKALEDKIQKEGTVLPGHILKVGSFLNQQIDVDFMMEMGREIARLFADSRVEKVLTVEASGIALAVAAGAALHVPAVFAKKSKTANVSGEVYSARVHSYTHGNDAEIIIPRAYLKEGERVLLVDDFLATGEAFRGLLHLCEQAGATAVGLCAAIEKGFQGGGDAFRAAGYKVESLAVIDKMDEHALAFRR